MPLTANAMNLLSPQQLSLGVKLNDDATFDNFYLQAEGQNALVLASLRQQLTTADEPFIYLWGPSGCGLSHLLQASCHAAQQSRMGFQYLPLTDLADVNPEVVLRDLDTLDYLAIDDLQSVAGDPVWEEALFNIYNRSRERGQRLLVAARQGPRDVRVELPDLKSRLQWGLTCYLSPLNDEAKQRALQIRARARGLELTDEVAQYLLQRLSRDTRQVFHYLEILDTASLTEQRKLTIPFVKKILIPQS